jgi:hypothetical protein
MFVSILLFVPFAMVDAANDIKNHQCNDDDYYLEHTEECENPPIGPVVPVQNGPQKENSPTNKDNKDNPKLTQQTDEYVEDEFTECASGNIDIFLNRVQSEKARITDAINNISKVEPVASIVNLCGVTLKHLEESISTIRKADMGGLLTQARETSKCFSTVSAWIEAHYESSDPIEKEVLKPIKMNKLIKVNETKESWKAEFNKLEEMQKERTAELGIYEKLKNLHSKSCLDNLPKPEEQ